MYEWNENKRKSNIAKHGVDFKLIEQFDWDKAVFIRTELSNFEQRDVIIGEISFDIFTVIIAEKVDGIIRIISMRKATKYEIRTYYDY